MPIELAQQSTHLHVNLTFILQPFELPWGIRLEYSVDMRRLQLREASIQTEAALLKCTHFLKAQSHIVHGALYQESIAGVSLKHEPVKEVLGLLEQAQGPVVLVLGDEVDG